MKSLNFIITNKKETTAEKITVMQNLSFINTNTNEAAADKITVLEPLGNQYVSNEHSERSLADENKHRNAVPEDKNAEVYDELDMRDEHQFNSGNKKAPSKATDGMEPSGDTNAYEQSYVTLDEVNMYDYLNPVNSDSKNTSVV